MPGMMMPNPIMAMAVMCQAQIAAKAQQNQAQGSAGMMGCSPMLAGANPMMVTMDPQQTGSQGGSVPEPSRKDAVGVIDPEVRELGDYFNIEDRWVKRLNETMRKRQDTKEQDIAKLYEVLERARSPTGLLTVKIGEMECGQFVGKVKPDKDVERLARKFKLDEHVTSRLTELVVRRKATKEVDLERIESHLKYCKRPSAMATLLAGKLLEGEVDELPDLGAAEVLMDKFKLDEDAKSKLREIVEKRAADKDEILVQIEKHLDSSSNPSSVLCKIARPLIDGEKLPEPHEKRGGGAGGAPGRGGDRDRERSRDRDRSRSRKRKSRSRSRSKEKRKRKRSRS